MPLCSENKKSTEKLKAYSLAVMVGFMCQTGWIMIPRYLVISCSGCFCKGDFFGVRLAFILVNFEKNRVTFIIWAGFTQWVEDHNTTKTNFFWEIRNSASTLPLNLKFYFSLMPSLLTHIVPSGFLKLPQLQKPIKKKIIIIPPPFSLPTSYTHTCTHTILFTEILNRNLKFDPLCGWIRMQIKFTAASICFIQVRALVE